MIGLYLKNLAGDRQEPKTFELDHIGVPPPRDIRQDANIKELFYSSWSFITSRSEPTSGAIIACCAGSNYPVGQNSHIFNNEHTKIIEHRYSTVHSTRNTQRRAMHSGGWATESQVLRVCEYGNFQLVDALIYEVKRKRQQYSWSGR